MCARVCVCWGVVITWLSASSKCEPLGSLSRGQLINLGRWDLTLERPPWRFPGHWSEAGGPGEVDVWGPRGQLQASYRAALTANRDGPCDVKTGRSVSCVW